MEKRIAISKLYNGSSLAPIVLFTYNRPFHTEATLKAVLNNPEAANSDLIVYSDHAKNEQNAPLVNQVRNLIKKTRGFKSITLIERTENFGLEKSVIEGVTEVIQKTGKVIVLEDDILVSRSFLSFMNTSLDFYQDQPNIMSITGFHYNFRPPLLYFKDVYLSPRCCSWGWATWKNRWDTCDWQVKDFPKFIHSTAAQEKFNEGGADLTEMLKLQMEGKINSWAIRWSYHHSKNDTFCLYPTQSMVMNAGFDGSGVHCDVQDTYRSKKIDLNRTSRLTLEKPMTANRHLIARFKKFIDDRMAGKMMLSEKIRRFPRLVIHVLKRINS